MSEQKDIVTGAFGFSGKYIAQQLLDRGHKVITLTRSINRDNPFGDRISAVPFSFEKPEELRKNLTGVRVLYNTYWVRFNYGSFTFDRAVRYSKILFDQAVKAGVQRVVHISITNPSLQSDLEYFRGKAEVETYLKSTGLSYAILRPAVLFGKEDILINNIAWALRRFPVFGVFGEGNYRIQPIHVNDLAELAVRYGQLETDEIIDAIGPETFTYRELVTEIGKAIGKRRPVISIPPVMGFLAAKMIGKVAGDVFVTRDEIKGLMRELLHVYSPPAGKTRLTRWAREHAEELGIHYASELKRRFNRKKSYREL